MNGQSPRHCLALVAAAYAGCAGIVLLPVFSVAMPGLGDTMNHLARMHILASIDHSAALQRFYRVRWTPIPYLAMDIVVPPLLHVLPIYQAGRLFAAACILLPVAGTAALHSVLHRRLSLVPCAAFLFSTNALLSLGFLNYLFTAGLALLLLAFWAATLAWPRWPRAALFSPLVLALYFGHAFACFAYCLAVAGLEAGRAWRAGFRPPGRILGDVAAALAQAVPALYFAATLNVASGYLGPLHTRYGTVADKLTALLSPVLFLNDSLHLFVALGAVLLAGLLARYLTLSALAWPAVLALALAALAMPHVLSSTWGTDLRLPLMACLCLVASLSLRIGGRRRALALAGLVAFLSVKSADAWIALHQADSEFAETRRLLSALPQGARLLVVNPAGHGTGREQVPISTIWHLPMVAVIDRDAFVPTLFSGLTTVRVRPGFTRSSTPNGLPISPPQWRQGATEPDDGAEHGDGQGARLYHFGWPQKFDYVLVQRFGADPGKLPEGLSPVGTTENMDLYRVDRGLLNLRQH